jgi:IS605 OrfB family transposase
MAAKYRMCDPVLQYDERNNTFYACIPFLALDTTPLAESYLGIDLGMRRIATLSDGTAIVDKEYLARRRRIRHNKSALRRHKRKSHSARRKLKVLRRRESNMCKDFSHRVANEILRHDGATIVMEDLSKIKRRTAKTEEGHKRTRHNNAMSQVPFFQLRQILTYKAPLVGKRVATVPPQYTSQEDCRTQSKEGCVRKGCRFYTADGKVFDADWNAAINICNRHHPTPFRLPIDGGLNFVGRQCQEANCE